MRFFFFFLRYRYGGASFFGSNDFYVECICYIIQGGLIDFDFNCALVRFRV